MGIKGEITEAIEFRAKKVKLNTPVPQVTPFYFDIDCSVRFLKRPYSDFLMMAPIIKKAYRYYFMLRSYYEEIQEEWREKERLRAEQQAKSGASRQQVRR